MTTQLVQAPQVIITADSLTMSGAINTALTFTKEITPGGDIPIGLNALAALTTGTNDTVVGTDAGKAITTGSNDTIQGRSAGILLTTGNQNTLAGSFSGASLTTQSDNVFEGFQAGQNATASQSVCIGKDAGKAIQNPSTLVGYQAGDVITTGVQDSASGWNALGACTTGSRHTCQGYNAGAAITTQTDSTFIGNESGLAATSSNVTAVGSQTASNSTSAVTAIGTKAGFVHTSGLRDTFLGQQAGVACTTSPDNCFSGNNSGAAVATGSGGNTFTGSGSGSSTSATLASGTFTGFNAGANCTGDNCTFTGKDAGKQHTSGTGNTFIGTQCCDNGVVTGTNNMCSGFVCGRALTSGSSNCFYGVSSGSAMTTGQSNCLGGASCGSLLTTGNSNCGWGPNCFGSATTASDNCAFGSQALSGLTTGTGHIGIGKDAGNALTTGSAGVCIANAGVAGESGIMRFGTAGTQLKNFQAAISGITTDAAALPCLVSGTGQLGTVSCMEEKKKDFMPIDEEKLKQFLHRIPVREYKYKEGHQACNWGPNIEDVQTLLNDDSSRFEDMIVEMADQSYGFATQHVPWMLLAEMQRMQRELDALQKKDSIKQNYSLKRKAVEEEFEEITVAKKSRRK